MPATNGQQQQQQHANNNGSGRHCDGCRFKLAEAALPDNADNNRDYLNDSNNLADLYRNKFADVDGHDVGNNVAHYHGHFNADNNGHVEPNIVANNIADDDPLFYPNDICYHIADYLCINDADF